jgi:hypothetical protein
MPCTVDSAIPHAWAVPRSEVPPARSKTTRARTAAGTRGRPRRRRSTLARASPARPGPDPVAAQLPPGGRFAGRFAGGSHPKPRARNPERSWTGGGGTGDAGIGSGGTGTRAVRLTPLRPLSHGFDFADWSGRPAFGYRTENQSFAGAANPAPAGRGWPRVSARLGEKVFRYTLRGDPLRS